MSTSAINSFSGTPSATSTTSRGLNDLSAEDFFTLLITELQQQDPFKPNDTNQLVQEMSTIRQMDMSVELNKTLGSFADQQKVVSATNMIGRHVQGIVYSGSNSGQSVPVAVQGTVTGIQFNSQGEAILELDNGGYLPVAGVITVRTQPPGETPTDETPPTEPPAETPPADPNDTFDPVEQGQATLTTVAALNSPTTELAARARAGLDGLLQFVGLSDPGASTLNALA